MPDSYLPEGNTRGQRTGKKSRGKVFSGRCEVPAVSRRMSRFNRMLVGGRGTRRCQSRACCILARKRALEGGKRNDVSSYGVSVDDGTRRISTRARARLTDRKEAAKSCGGKKSKRDMKVCVSTYRARACAESPYIGSRHRAAAFASLTRKPSGGSFRDG